METDNSSICVTADNNVELEFWFFKKIEQRIIIAYLLLFSNLHWLKQNKQITFKIENPWVGVVFYDGQGTGEDILCRMLKN